LSEFERDKQPILIQRALPSAHLVDVETFEEQQRGMTLREGTARVER